MEILDIKVEFVFKIKITRHINSAHKFSFFGSRLPYFIFYENDSMNAFQSIYITYLSGEQSGAKLVTHYTRITLIYRVFTTVGEPGVVCVVERESIAAVRVSIEQRGERPRLSHDISFNIYFVKISWNNAYNLTQLVMLKFFLHPAGFVHSC